MIKKITLVLVAALLLVGVASAASAATELKIRSSVYSNPTGDVAITADDFAAFWYDVDDGKSS
ncbi:MAG: hypothetical protein PWP01_450, partial [Methanosarcinales archaeon]|nr:hypothetical protein [Methanosarcinales archaeon]